MKNYKRRLSIILTLVLIITSMGFTGAFAGSGEVSEVAGNESQTIEQNDSNTENLEAPMVELQSAPAALAGEESGAGATYTITWKNYDGTLLETDTDVAEGADPTYDGAAQPTRESDADYTYEFAGWEPEVTKVTADATYTAKFEAKSKAGSFTIKWVNEDGTLIKETTAEAGTVPVYDGQTPEKENTTEDGAEYSYVFKGWEPAVAEATTDATYTAKYEKRSLTGQPKKPSVTTYSSYNRVRLGWKKVTKDVNGVKYADGVVVKYRVTPVTKAIKSQKQDGKKVSYATTKTLDPLKTYKFKVVAYITTENGEVVSDAVTKSDSPVRPMRYKLTIKQGGTIYAHNTGRGKSLSAGQVIYADRFQTGRYIFNEGKNVYWVSRTRIGGKSAEYTTKWNYSDEEMQYYVNDRGVNSKTPYLIMVNSYTQHLYIFKGTKSGLRYKNWKIFTNAKKRSANKYGKEKTLAKGAVMDWEVGTGTASDPTPTGEKGLKETKPWLKSRHSIPWWTSFNGTASLHGDKYARNDEKLDMGKPVSSGCIRNPHERAHWIFDLCKKGTQLVIF